jgi:hypothetical protein
MAAPFPSPCSGGWASKILLLAAAAFAPASLQQEVDGWPIGLWYGTTSRRLTRGSRTQQPTALDGY